MSDLRSKLIRLAYQQPELRKDILPLLRVAKSFDDAVKGKKFRNPETGNQVEFGSLPAEEQKKIRAKWTKANPRGSGGAGEDPKELMKSDSDAYFAQHISGGLSKKSLTDALKDTDWTPRGKGSFDKKRNFLELILDHKGRKLPLRVTFSGSHYTQGDRKGNVILWKGGYQMTDDVFDLSGDIKKDIEQMHRSLKEMVLDANSWA